jgi:hypothetical protein
LPPAPSGGLGQPDPGRPRRPEESLPVVRGEAAGDRDHVDHVEGHLGETDAGGAVELVRCRRDLLGYTRTPVLVLLESER